MLLIIGITLGSAVAEQIEHHHKSSPKKVAVEAPQRCETCGMDRSVFSYSRVVVNYRDGSSVGTCSLNCAYQEVTSHPGKKVGSIRSADYYTRKLIDAKTAVWVVGGRKHGVMSPLAKWAFGKKSDAESYVAEFGGTMVGFDEAWKAAGRQLARQ